MSELLPVQRDLARLLFSLPEAAAYALARGAARWSCSRSSTVTHVWAPMKPHPPMWLISTLAGRVAGRMVSPAVNPSVNDDLVSE